MKSVEINKIVNNINPLHINDMPPVKQVNTETMKFVDKIINSTTETILDFLHKNTKAVRLRGKDGELYRYNNILLMRSNGDNSYRLEENIKRCQELDMVPDFVKYFQLGKDDFLTILETDGSKLVPYTKNAEKVSPKVKQGFKKEVLKLLDKGVVNNEIFANKDALLVTSDGKKIIFADWSDIAPVSISEKQNLRNYIAKWQI